MIKIKRYLIMILFIFILHSVFVYGFIPEPWIEVDDQRRFFKFYSDITTCTLDGLEQSFLFTTYFNLYDYRYNFIQSPTPFQQTKTAYKDRCGREYTIDGTLHSKNSFGGQTTTAYKIIHNSQYTSNTCRLETFLDPQDRLTDNQVMAGLAYSSSDAPVVVNYCTIDCDGDGDIDFISPSFKRYDDIDNDARTSWLTVDPEFIPRGDEYRHRQVNMQNIFRCSYGRKDVNVPITVTISCNMEKNLPNYNSYDNYNKASVMFKSFCSNTHMKDDLDFNYAWVDIFPDITTISGDYVFLPCGTNPFCNIKFVYKVMILNVTDTTEDTNDEYERFVMNITDEYTHTEPVSDGYVMNVLGQLLGSSTPSDSQHIEKQRSISLEAEIANEQLNFYDSVLLLSNLFFNIFLIIAYIVEFVLMGIFFYLSVPYMFNSIMKLFKKLARKK